MGSLSNPNAYSGIVKNSDSGGSGFPVNITDPQEGQILTFNSENEEWVNSNGRIKVVTVNTFVRVATQEDVDNYKQCYDTDLQGPGDIEIGETYQVNELSASYNEIANYDIVIIKYIDGRLVAKSYYPLGEFYNLYLKDDNSDITATFYSLNADANLRNYGK